MAFRATPSSLFFARSGSFASSIRFRSLERIKLRFPSRSASNESRSGSLLAWYSTKLDTHPLLSKGISSGLIAGAGDWLCQTGIEGGQWDYVRTGRFTFLGTFLVAPVIHVWFAFLSKAIPGVSLVAVSQRVAVDQFFFAPCFMSSWLSCLWFLEGEHQPSVIVQRLAASMPSVLVANWGLWIPAQIVNFRFVPGKFQVLYSNVVALLWNVYLSYFQASKREQVE